MDRHAAAEPSQVHGIGLSGVGWRPGVVEAFELPAGDVHVWRFALNPPTEIVAQLNVLLDETEQSRRDRFRTADLRRRFACGRGGLRALLGRYLGVPPESVAFTYGVHGKPGLKHEPAGGFSFNLAHTSEVALLAVARDRVLGVDIETCRPLESAEKIVERFFAPAEREEYALATEGDRLGAFYRGWSRKEAFLKAKGTGLSTQLDSFDVSLAPGDAAAVMRVGDDPDEPGRWTLRELDVGPEYAAAVAASVQGRGECVPIRCWDLLDWDVILKRT